MSDGEYSAAAIESSQAVCVISHSCDRRALSFGALLVIYPDLQASYTPSPPPSSLSITPTLTSTVAEGDAVPLGAEVVVMIVTDRHGLDVAHLQHGTSESPIH